MRAREQTETVNWQDRVIPLPKEMAVAGAIGLAAGQVGLDILAGAAPPVLTAARLLAAFARGPRVGSPFTVRLLLLDAAGPDDVPPALRERLLSLPNPEQAYALAPTPTCLLLVAPAAAGLLYAARTLNQLVRPPERVDLTTQVAIPLASIVDWPDIPERGQWGIMVANDMPWTSQWKLNVVDQWADAVIEDDRPQVHIDRRLFATGAEFAVNVVPYILHIEQLARYVDLAAHSDAFSTPDPGQPLPSDYYPGLCMSSAGARDLLAGWLAAAAALPHVNEIMVCLSEDRAPCFCPRCTGKEPFLLEVQCVVDAFAAAKAVNPGVRLRLETSQGSYPVNDRIVAAVPRDVGISYYDGGRTYDSSRKPMVYPVMEAFAHAGGQLTVYPQITHCWRTVFPWTTPQFVRYRAQEFADKRVHRMIGYAVPSNRFHEFNVVAMAEWAWNSQGRSPEEFARAYATVTGLADGDNDAASLFAAWAARAGEAGWTLAESRLLLTLIYDPALGLGGEQAADHRFQQAFLQDTGNLPASLATAREALALATQMGVPDLLDESGACLAGLEFLAGLRFVTRALATPEQDASRDDLLDVLETLERNAYIVRGHLFAWAERIAARSGEKIHSRLPETALVMLRTCDALRDAAAHRGLPEALQRPEYTLRTVGGWSAADFAAGPHAVLRLDITEHVPQSGGQFQAGFDFLDGAYGATVETLRVLSQPPGTKHPGVVAETPEQLGRDLSTVSMWERWKEFRLAIPPAAAGSTLLLEVTLDGLATDAPEGRRTCSGRIGIRRLRPLAEIEDAT